METGKPEGRPVNWGAGGVNFKPITLVRISLPIIMTGLQGRGNNEATVPVGRLQKDRKWERVGIGSQAPALASGMRA